MNQATSRPATRQTAGRLLAGSGARRTGSTARVESREGSRTGSPLQGVLRGLRRVAICCVLALAPAATLAGPTEGIMVEHFPGVPFADLREALADAIADEGLSAPVVSGFGAMLERTAPDLGHDPALYGDAEIFSFCSAGVAARLVAEAREHIALCPLSIAVYSLPQTPRDATLAWRPPTLDAPGGDAVRALLTRIVAGAARLVGRR